MSTTTSSSPPFPLPLLLLRHTVRLLVQSNELLGIFNPWIITPSVHRQHSGTPAQHAPIPTVHPLITTVAYAVLEPLLSMYNMRSADPPWTDILSAAPTHVLLTLTCMVFYVMWRKGRAKAEAEARDRGGWRGLRDGEGEEEGEWEKRDSADIKKEKYHPPAPPTATTTTTTSLLSHLPPYLTLIIPLLLAAHLNTLLHLLSQSLFLPAPLLHTLTQHSYSHLPTLLPTLLLLPLTLLTFLLSRTADSFTWRCTSRSITITPLTSILDIVLYQTILFALRAYVRTRVGVDPWLAWSVPEAEGLRERFGVWCCCGREQREGEDWMWWVQRSGVSAVGSVPMLLQSGEWMVGEWMGGMREAEGKAEEVV